jgi:hypothetical protein
MTTAAATPAPAPAPKKSNKMLAVVSLVLILIFGTNHFTARVGYVTLGIDVNDSTIVVTPAPVEAPAAPAVDTAKADTSKH